MKTLIAMTLSLMFTTAWGQQIQSVNFLQEGEISKLVVELDKPVIAERFHVKDDKQIILDVKNAKVDPKLLRGIDTSEFDGAIVYISGYPRPGSPKDIRFAVQLRDNVRSVLDTQGNKLILSIENRFGVFSRARLQESTNAVKTSDLQGATGEAIVDNVRFSVPKSNSVEDILENLVQSGPKKYIGKKISINVNEIPVKDLLKMISETSGFNIILDNEVNKVPPMTLSLTNIPWDQALDTILSLARLVATKNTNILSIKTVEQTTKEREALAAAEALKIGLEPLVTKVFPISYADITSLMTIIKDYQTEKRGTMQQDARTNSLIVKDTVDAIERIQKIVELLDTQTPQILIESKIVEANERYSKMLGLRNGLSFGYDPITPSNQLDVNSGPGFNFSSTGAGTEAAPGLLNLSIGRLRRLGDLNLALDLMENEAKGRVVTSPKVITQNKKPAIISSTDSVNFITQVAGANGSTAQITTVSVVLNLTVTPQVTNEGSINLEVSLSKGGFTPSDIRGAPPSTTQRQVRTNVLVDNGSTVVLGGLYTTTETESHSGVPYLKDLPIIGWLFRTSYNPSNSRNELLVFLTPRIVNQDEAGLVNRQSLSAGNKL